MSEGSPEQVLARLEATIAEIDRSADQERRRRAGRDGRRGEAARRGELGQDWQEVQRRIDAGQTSLADVFQGRDETPAARRLLAESHATIERISVETDPPPVVRDEMLAADAEWDHLRREAGTPITPPHPPLPEGPG